MAGAIEFVLPDFTLFLCHPSGPTLESCDEEIRAHLPPDLSIESYSLIPSRLTIHDSDAEVPLSTQISSLSNRRIYVRWGPAPEAKIAISIQNGAGDRMPLEIESVDQIEKVMSKVTETWKFAVGLQFAGVALDDTLTIGEIGVAAGESLNVVERRDLQIQYPGTTTPLKLRIPARLAALEDLFAFLDEDPSSECPPSRRMRIDGVPVEDIAQIYQLPEDGVVVFDEDPEGNGDRERFDDDYREPIEEDESPADVEKPPPPPPFEFREYSEEEGQRPPAFFPVKGSGVTGSDKELSPPESPPPFAPASAPPPFEFHEYSEEEGQRPPAFFPVKGSGVTGSDTELSPPENPPPFALASAPGPFQPSPAEKLLAFDLPPPLLDDSGPPQPFVESTSPETFKDRHDRRKSSMGSHGDRPSHKRGHKKTSDRQGLGRSKSLSSDDVLDRETDSSPASRPFSFPSAPSRVVAPEVIASLPFDVELSRPEGESDAAALPDPILRPIPSVVETVFSEPPIDPKGIIPFFLGDDIVRQNFEPGVTIEEVEFTLSRLFNQEVEIADDPYFVFPNMRFEDLATAITDSGCNMIGLRPAFDHLFLFEDSSTGTRIYMRFNDRAQVREVKASLAVGSLRREFHLEYRKTELPDGLRIRSIKDFDPSEPIKIVQDPEDPIRLIDDSGKTSTIETRGEKPKVTLSQIKDSIDADREFDIFLLGAPVNTGALKSSRRAPFRIVYRSADYRFKDRGQVITRQFSPKSTFGALRQFFIDAETTDPSRIVFSLGDVALSPDDTLARVSPDEVLSIIRLKEPFTTIGDLRRETPGAREVYRSGQRVIVNSVPLGTISSITKIPTTPGCSRRFTVRLPRTPLRPEMSDRSRSFFFDSSQTILDLREVISDIGRISFPPYALYYRGARLQDDDFLFEIGYEDSALIDVRLIPGATSTVRVNPNNGKSDIILETDASDTTVADLKVRLADEFDLPPEMELVASGKVLHEIDTVAEAGLTHESYVHVYAKDEFLGDTAMEMTTFEFSVGPTQDELSLPWFDATTVGDARCDLAKTLFKPVAELSIVDPAKRLCLQDADKLAEYATPGRPFLVLLVDGEAILTAQECRVIAKWMPGTDVEAKGKELFLQCGRKLTVFQRTCKTRGYV